MADLSKPGTFASHERRRRRERYALEGFAELMKQGGNGPWFKAALNEHVRDRLPGFDPGDPASRNGVESWR